MKVKINIGTEEIIATINRKELNELIFHLKKASLIAGSRTSNILIKLEEAESYIKEMEEIPWNYF